MKETRLHLIKNKSSQLQLIHDDKIRYRGEVMFYEILGRLSIDLTDLTVMLVAVHDSELKRYRRKINLYSSDAVGLLSQELAELTGIDPMDIERDLEKLTDLLEIHREENLFHDVYSNERIVRKKNKSNRAAIELLNLPDLLTQIGNLLEQAGAIGEKKLLTALFLVSASYKNQTPLHAIIQGSNSSCKSLLADSIAACLPKNDLLALTRITDKSLYYFPSELLHQKLLVLHEFENLDGPSFLALRELQETNQLTLGTTRRDRFGNLVPTLRKVEARFSSLITSAKTQTDTKNWKNAIIFELDDSPDQTQRLIDFQNRFFSGDLNSKAEEDARTTLSALVELLKTKKVVNPYANQIKLPAENAVMRNMHAQFMTLVSQITLFHQFQRKTDSQDRVITEINDIQQALSLFEKQLFCIYDQYSSTVQKFAEQLARYIERRNLPGQNYFTSTEIRKELGYNKTFVFRALEVLIKTDSVQICGGTSNKGFHYCLTHEKNGWQNQKSILTQVTEQVSKLKNHLL